MNEAVDSYLNSLEDEPFTGYSADDVLALACANPRGGGVKRKLAPLARENERVYVSFCKYGETRYGYLDGVWEGEWVWVTHWRAIDTNRYTITMERIETSLLSFAPAHVCYPDIILSELDEAMHAGKLDDMKALQSRFEDLWFTLRGYR